jgi:hypothetical protein
MDQDVMFLEQSTAATMDGLRARIKVLSIDLVEPEPRASVMGLVYGVGEPLVRGHSCWSCETNTVARNTK